MDQGEDSQGTAESLFDLVADIVYFVKDAGGLYVAVNQTLVERCGKRHKGQLIGRSADELFPAPLGARISAQDLAVVRDRRTIQGQLELHLYPGGREGWCLTWKLPLVAASGEVTGLSGISRDLNAGIPQQADMAQLSEVLEHVRKNLSGTLRVEKLAVLAGLSSYQLDQRIRAVYGISAGQYITRARIDQACHLLSRTNDPISQIALDCGYGDQTAFTRQFGRSVGLTPRAYREGAFRRD